MVLGVRVTFAGMLGGLFGSNPTTSRLYFLALGGDFSTAECAGEVKPALSQFICPENGIHVTSRYQNCLSPA